MHIAPRLYPVRHPLGKVVIDRHHKIRSVVAKIGDLNSMFDELRVECIAGENGRFAQKIKEEGAEFKVDVTKAFWSAKLKGERDRIINDYFKDGQVLCDPFCGVGPLSIRAVKKYEGFAAICNDYDMHAIKFCR